MRRRRNTGLGEELEPCVALWVLRILVPLGGGRELTMSRGFCNDALAEAVGLKNDDDLPFDKRVALAELRQHHRAVEAERARCTIPPLLRRNVKRLGELVGLSELEQEILSFVVLIHTDRMLEDAGDLLGALTTSKLSHVLATILDRPREAILAALSPQGVLGKSGLVSVDMKSSNTLKGKLDLLSSRFADYLSSTTADPIHLLREVVLPSRSPELTLADYEHLTPVLGVLHPYLKRAVSKRRKGVNILFYGKPGTGKSQLAKVLAREFGCELFEVASEDEDGDPINGEKRLRAFRAAQSFLGRRQALVLFDEVEDVFSDGDNFFGRKSTAQTRKAWINRMLEDNPVPAFWLTNSIEGIDPAFIRRFDMVCEVPVPPKRQRERIVRAAFKRLVDDGVVARLAESSQLTPAVVTRAAGVVRFAGLRAGKQATTQAVELLINNTLAAQGHGTIKRHDPNRLPEIYDPAFIRADADLARVSAGLAEARRGRICLYGPPGTGKTAYGRWLAEQLGVPLKVKRASDLMDKYVGENEKNIASAFREAEEEGAILLMDEVDSFLQDRRGAARSWEVTLVNEMLTQMESFPGVFIASTNLMSGLDQAALRRFDLKVKFDFLSSDQATALIARHCAHMSLPPPGTEAIARLRQLRNLTPGDFAAVVRQHAFRRLSGAEEFVVALEQESRLKGAETRANPIGFIQ